MTTHAPGPWTAHTDAETLKTAIYPAKAAGDYHDRPFPIAFVAGGTAPAIVAATARMLAAGPALADAARLAREALLTNDSLVAQDALLAIERALDEAEPQRPEAALAAERRGRAATRAHAAALLAAAGQLVDLYDAAERTNTSEEGDSVHAAIDAALEALTDVVRSARSAIQHAR